MLRRRSLLALSALAPLLTACSKGQVDGRVQLALDWFPEPEHGGFFAAEVAGDYAANGLDLELVDGRPDAPILPQVAAGRVAFADWLKGFGLLLIPFGSKATGSLPAGGSS